MRCVIAQSELAVHVTDDVSKRSAARDDKHATRLRDLDDRRQDAIEVIRSSQQSSADLDHKVEAILPVRLKPDPPYSLVGSGFSRTYKQRHSRRRRVARRIGPDLARERHDVETGRTRRITGDEVTQTGHDGRLQ